MTLFPGFASFNERLTFFKKHRSPTAMRSIERAADSFINFQAVVNKRGFTSFDELLKYCRQFFNFSAVVNNRLSKFELLKCWRVFNFSTVVKNRLRDFRLFRANYGTVLQY